MGREYTIEELAEATGLTERTLRLYRTKGLLDAPTVRGRTGYYDQRHMAQLRMVKAFVDHGFPLALISSLASRDLVQVEIARLLRAMIERETSAGRRRLDSAVTIDPMMISVMDRQRPGSLEELVTLGVMMRDEAGNVHADAVLVALVNALYLHDAKAGSLGGMGIAAGRLAHEFADGQRQDPLIDLGNEDALRLLVELATSVFREALSHALRR